jgi:hypothetical protein
MKYMQAPSSKELFKVTEREAEILALRGWKKVSTKEITNFFAKGRNHEN